MGVLNCYEIGMKESLRYLQNAKKILARTPIEDNDYVDIKPVREAFSNAYLAILEAINEAKLNSIISGTSFLLTRYKIL
ncbi:MAG TPA: DUF5618 family protein [Candidatus Brocadiaceae bacterium]